MEQTAITFVINQNTYRFGATDTDLIREMPAADRQLLIALLESVKQQEAMSRAAVDKFAQRTASDLDTATRSTAAASAASTTQPSLERLGSGDVDALMARLAMEDKRSKKPPLTKQSVYKVAAVAALIIVLISFVA